MKLKSGTIWPVIAIALFCLSSSTLCAQEVEKPSRKFPRSSHEPEVKGREPNFQRLLGEDGKNSAFMAHTNRVLSEEEYADLREKRLNSYSRPNARPLAKTQIEWIEAENERRARPTQAAAKPEDSESPPWSMIAAGILAVGFAVFKFRRY